MQYIYNSFFLTMNKIVALSQKVYTIFRLRFIWKNPNRISKSLPNKIVTPFDRAKSSVRITNIQIRLFAMGLVNSISAELISLNARWRRFRGPVCAEYNHYCLIEKTIKRELP